MEHLKYPTGRFRYPAEYTTELTTGHIRTLRDFPELLKNEVANLDEKKLDETYRPGSWNIRQLIHHLGESHLNAYMRIKLALTEDNPMVKTYIEEKWVQTAENNILQPAVSIQLIEAVHIKMVTLLSNLTNDEMLRTFRHPDFERLVSIRDLAALYSWHGLHHLGHIRLALQNAPVTG